MKLNRIFHAAPFPTRLALPHAIRNAARLAAALAMLLVGLSLAQPADADEIRIGTTGLAFSFHPDSLQMPLHVASPTEFFTRGLIQSFKDATMFRQSGYFADGAPGLDTGCFFSIGSAIPFFRLHPAGRDDLGIGFQGKWMIPFETAGHFIAMAMEFDIDVALTASVHPSFALSVSRKHICSHLLDRSFFTDGLSFLGTSSSDTDPEHGPMAIRDSIVFSGSFSPEKLLFPRQDIVTTSFYADYGLSVPGYDLLNDARYTRPSYRTSRYFQYGAQASVRLAIGKTELGSLYGGCNFSLYESTGYAVNTAYSVGYALPAPKGRVKMAFDLSYYDGRAVLEEYYGQRERYLAFGLKLLQ